jgi:hypothetical protein
MNSVLAAVSSPQQTDFPAPAPQAFVSSHPMQASFLSFCFEIFPCYYCCREYSPMEA